MYTSYLKLIIECLSNGDKLEITTHIYHCWIFIYKSHHRISSLRVSINYSIKNTDYWKCSTESTEAVSIDYLQTSKHLFNDERQSPFVLVEARRSNDVSDCQAASLHMEIQFELHQLRVPWRLRLAMHAKPYYGNTEANNLKLKLRKLRALFQALERKR